MNSNFEPIVAETYVNLCVEWRQSYSKKSPTASSDEAKLAALESVIEAFEFKTPTAPALRARPTRGGRPGTPERSTSEKVALGD